MVDLYIRENGQTLGPFSEDALRLRCAGAELAESTMSWRTGEKRWISLHRRWAKRDRPGILLAVSWMLSMALAVIALVVSAQLFDLPEVLRDFAVLAGVVVVAACLSPLLAYRHWKTVLQANGRPTLGSVLCALVAGLAAICSLSTLGLQKRISDNRASLADASMVFDSAHGELRIVGNIADRFAEDLRVALDRAAGIKRITIDSPGGFVDDALEAGRLVLERGLTVRVLNQCASACTVLWSSAPRREMAFDARLGLHQSRFDVELPTLWREDASEEIEAQTSAVLRKAGFSEALLQKQATTSADDMYWIDPAALYVSGVQLVVVDAQGSALTGSRIKLMSVISELDGQSPYRKMLEAYAARAPKLADSFGPDLHAAWQAQDTDGVMRVASEISAAAKAYALVNAPDAALIDWLGRMRGILGEAIAEPEASACSILLDGARAGDPADSVSGQVFVALAALVDAVPAEAAIDPSSVRRGSTHHADALFGRTFRQKVQQGFPSSYDLWSPNQKCRFMDGIYAAVLRMPAAEAAGMIRIIEGVK